MFFFCLVFLVFRPYVYVWRIFKVLLKDCCLWLLRGVYFFCEVKQQVKDGGQGPEGGLAERLVGVAGGDGVAGEDEQLLLLRGMCVRRFWVVSRLFRLRGQWRLGWWCRVG